MIRLEHINLVVNDITTSLTFYKAAFPEWKVRDSGAGEWSGKPREWLHFGDDTTYLALNNNAESPPRNLAGHQAGLAHFAFEINDLKAMQMRLLEAGFKHHSRVNNNPYRHNIYYLDPDGNEIEFVQYFSDLVEQRNSTV
ncbi:VOC family protein [Psychromonas hadalis]|uniref:VOC family protein n=1 Tax=Psychromonas hadalis TaxID=211669 RepID=UPI0003B53701|nr:VOC family protein [Psychromonas hadalis]